MLLSVPVEVLVELVREVLSLTLAPAVVLVHIKKAAHQ
tara:strand:- start:527 stop:640 length:114 start_codon:yes stop_codon:yes gene_type:complete